MPANRLMTPSEQLALVPLRNAKVRVLEDMPVRLILEIDAVYPVWLGPLPRLLGVKKVKKVQLDGLALLMWRRLDDRISLAGVVDWLAAEQQLEFNESRLLTLQFLRVLAMKGLLVMGDRTGLGG